MNYNLTRCLVWLAFVAMLVIAIVGCQADAPPQPAGPPIVLVPPPAAAAPTPATAAAVVLLRDTNALQSKVTRYVFRKGAKSEVIDQLTEPTAAMTAALGRLQARKTRAGYRLSDVIAARAAADALAAVYQRQVAAPAALPVPPPVPTEPQP